LGASLKPKTGRPLRKPKLPQRPILLKGGYQ
jgi:hypothetical protein